MIFLNIDELKEKGICPTCYNKEYGNVFNDLGNRLLYEDDIIAYFRN